jgi:hypothetical protein
VPRQNRVTPLGDIIATAERGSFMGNRGILQDESGIIRRAWQVKRWLLCLLEFRGRKRSVMTPSRYTELFFLDEATGLAAGHRPCFECRRERFVAFQQAWQSGQPSKRSSSPATAAGMDARLHAERLGPNRTKRTFQVRLAALPDGVFVQRLASPADAYLIWKGVLLQWSPGGYRKRTSHRADEEVLVLTPQSTVEAIRASYAPVVHSSADQV